MSITSTFNPADVIVTPGHTKFLGQVHYAQGNVTERRIRVTETKRHVHSGRMVSTLKDVGWKVTIPVYLPFAALVPLLQAYSAMPFGRPIAPRVVMTSALNTTTDRFTAVAHGLATADAIQAGWDEAAPTLGSGTLSKRTLYYASRIDADTFKMHTTSVGASGGTAVVDFSAAQTLGNFWVSSAVPLSVYRRTNVLRTYLNAWPVEFPDLVCGNGELAWQGNLVFRAFRAFGAVPADGVAAFYTEATQAYDLPVWDASTALTSPANVAFGASPWDDIASENGFRFSFKPTLADTADGVWPVASQRMTGFDVGLKFRPLGITRAEYDAMHAETLGAQITFSRNVVAAMADYTLTGYGGALLTESDTIYSTADSIIGDMEIKFQGNATSDNKPPFLIA